MEAKSKCWEKVEKVEEEDDDEVMVGDHEILKRRISSHPLYGLLVEAHLGCLKVLSLSLSLSLSLCISKNCLHIYYKFDFCFFYEKMALEDPTNNFC